MGKFKRVARKQTNHHDQPRSGKQLIAAKDSKRKEIQPRRGAKDLGQENPVKQSFTNIKQKIPFSKHDHVLLVGEGDFSFALSLVKHHKFQHLTATCYDSRDILYSKYPRIGRTIKRLVPGEETTVNTGQAKPQTDESNSDNETSEWGGLSESEADSKSLDTDSHSEDSKKRPPVELLYGIDATKLSTSHKKVLQQFAPFTKIGFNFPHVGGLSTDVNRQVRYNQELLVGFFKAAKGLLSSPTRRARVPDRSDRYSTDDEDLSDPSAEDNQRKLGAVSGQILVTIFEGEPYTLWNIRDLARHSGLKVVESFKFPWSAYPGYQHARTIGDITHGKDRGDEGKRKGAWRGEERDARCYVLEDKDATPMETGSNRKKRKYGQDGEESD